MLEIQYIPFFNLPEDTCIALKKGILKIVTSIIALKLCNNWRKRRIGKKYKCSCIHKITDLTNRQFNAPICRNREIIQIRQKMI